MRRGCCCARPGFTSSPSPPWRSASARTPPSSASSTRSCCGRCPTRCRPARRGVGAQSPARQEEQRRLSRQLHSLARAEQSFKELSAVSMTFRTTLTGAGDATSCRCSSSPARSSACSASGRRSAATSRLRRTRRGSRSSTISDRLWRQRFGADPSIVNRNIMLERPAQLVVGVMPPGFSILDKSVDVWPPSASRRRRARRAAAGRAWSAASRTACRWRRRSRTWRACTPSSRGCFPRSTPAGPPRRAAAAAADGRRQAGALGDARRGRLRAAHRLRERRQPGARAGDGAPARAGGARGARRRPRPADPADARRERAAVARRRSPVSCSPGGRWSR